VQPVSRARPNSSSQAAAAVSRWPLVLAGSCVALATAATYANSLHVPFLFDDGSAIVRNASIRHLWSLDVFTAPLYATGATGRPLVNLSLALNYALGGNDVRGYHLLNLLLHVGSALLLLGLVRRTLLTAAWRERVQPEARSAAASSGTEACRYANTALPIATATALLWALHPLQTESVTCIIQRTELLGGGLLLLTLYCFVRAIEAPLDPLELKRAESNSAESARRLPVGASLLATSHTLSREQARSHNPTKSSRRWAAGAIAACILGVTAKEFMVVAPVLALLYDRTFVAGSFRAAWAQHRRLYLGLAACWPVLAALLLQTPQRNHNVGFGLGVSSWEYLLTQCRALVLYLRLSVWPHPLVLDYGTGTVQALAAVWWEAGLIVVLAAGTLWALWRRPALGFLGAWFFVILAPSSSFIPLTTQTMAEHRMYLPLLVLLLAGVLALWRWIPRYAPVVSGGLALVGALLSWQRNEVYSSRLSIWRDTAAHAPGNFRAHYNLGNALVAAGRGAEAVPSYETALKLKPDAPSVAFNLASTLLQLGRGAEAIGYFEAALRQGPDAADIRVNLAVALAQSGRLEEAISHWRRAIELEPRAVDVRVSLGQALQLLGRTAEAVREYQIALQLNPANEQARAGLSEARQSRR
jgi:protein O-mannosyl-transferase